MTIENIAGRSSTCKIVTIVSEKGGSGKTSLAYLLASAGISQNMKVHVVDGDRNPQFLNWRGTVQAAHNDAEIEFPENLSASKLPSSIQDIEAHLSDTSHDCDLLLVDTRPGCYPDTEDAAYMSDVILVPGMPRAGELQLTMSTVAWMLKARKAFPDMESFPSIKVPVINATVTMVRAIEEENVDPLTAADYELLGRFSELPYMETVIPNSRVVETLSHDGPLTMQIGQLAGRPTAVLRKMLWRANLLLDEVMRLEPFVEK